MNSALGIISALIFFAAFVPYILAIMRGECKPKRSSWIIWSSMDTVTFAAIIAAGSFSWLLVGALSGAYIVLALSTQRGEGGWSTLDKLCLAGGAFGIILWALTKAQAAIISNIVVLLVGSVPTIVSVWRTRTGEDKFAWTLYTLDSAIGIMAVPAWTIQDAAIPIAFFAIDFAIVFPLYLKKN